MNQAFGVNNTTKDITHSGPVAQKLALHKGATLFANLTGIETITPISMGTLKQAALGTTIVVDFDDTAGDGLQLYTLNKVAGAPNGSVARALINQLNFKRVGDCALLHFFACERLTGTGGVVINTDDTSISPDFAILFDGTSFLTVGGEAVAEIRATNVTPGAETVSFFASSQNAFI